MNACGRPCGKETSPLLGAAFESGLLRTDEDEALAAIGEAVGIGERLHCRPLLDRAETIQSAQLRTTAS